MTAQPPTLRELRLARGWSQHTLARKAGVSQRSVWNAEHGIGSLRAETRRRLLRVLGVAWSRNVEIFGPLGQGA